MKSSLHAHQVMGASWMLSRELCEDGPRGGILADEMGMGKTLQALACIVTNMSDNDGYETSCPATLIVAPATAIDQWTKEIEKHINNEGSKDAIHYKKSANLPLLWLMATKTIILASYHEVSKQFPIQSFRARVQNLHENADEWREKEKDNFGPLFKIPFWRLVLDEAHQIKNKDSLTSIACQNLLGRHRWAMSGTPITNSLEELRPYLKFLKPDWSGDLKAFQYLYGSSVKDDDTSRLEAIMKILMLRRTMSDTHMGRPLYEIPMCHISENRVKLTREERVIYNVVESRYRDIINSILRKSRARDQKVRLRDLDIYIVFLLRLRQGVAHPFLLESAFKHALKPKDLDQIQHLLKEKEGLCRICCQEPLNAQTAKCEHVFCEQCLFDYMIRELQDGNIVPRCPDCRKPLTEYKSGQLSDMEDSDTEGSVRQSTPQKNRFGSGQLGRDALNQHPKLKKSQSMFLRESDRAHPRPVVPSSKTLAVMNDIRQWGSEAPDDKIIVFWEFKMTAAICGRMLQAEGIEFLYFFGDMSPKAKEKAIQEFHGNLGIKLASFRCGAAALNLTCANRVILVDPWWNVSIEMQAFGRVFRIGQLKETYFRRILADRTIDNRMEKIQEMKTENISKVMGSGDKRGLSVEDIISLFGIVKKFEDGGLEVVSDDEADDEVDDESDEETDESEEEEEYEDV
ncbi:SNF2 family N-terminal domain-containing protein [Xylaria cf. heliscus]|nr:SNF2 family N-terminal domain-containing protein [Xylaria cf. heliscus]